MLAGAAFKLSGTTSAFPTGFGTTTLAPTSTVNYAGSGAQTIGAQAYGNLTISGARTTNSVTFAGAGTIGVAGTFTASATFSARRLHRHEQHGRLQRHRHSNDPVCHRPPQVQQPEHRQHELVRGHAGCCHYNDQRHGNGPSVTAQTQPHSNNGGFAIVGNAGKNFTVSNAATFTLTGTADGHGLQQVLWDHAAHTKHRVLSRIAPDLVSAEAYGNLSINGGGSRNMADTAMTIAGDFIMSGPDGATQRGGRHHRQWQRGHRTRHDILRRDVYHAVKGVMAPTMEHSMRAPARSF